VYSTRDRDKDLSRGMGHHLRWPHPTSVGTKRHRPNHDPSFRPSPVPEVVPPAPSPVVPLPQSVGPVDPSGLDRRVLRSRRPPSVPRDPRKTVPAPRSRVPVTQRWFYEPAFPVSTLSSPVTPLLAVPSLAPDTTVESSSVTVEDTSGPILDSVLRRDVARFVDTLLPLKPQQPWMLEGDHRSDDVADADWCRATARLFGNHPGTENASHRDTATVADAVLARPVDATSSRPVSVTPLMLNTLLTAASSSPFVPADLSHARPSPKFQSDPPDLSCP
jgi:hypothetical protein